MKTTPPDAYEREHMDGARAIVRQRVRAAWWAHAFFAVLCGGMLVQVAAGRDHAVGLFAAAVIALTWFALMTLRTVVTPTHVHVQLGVFGPRIPIAAIVEASVVPRFPLSIGGWGIRMTRDGWAYSVPAFGKRGVRLVRDEGGTRSAVVVMSDDPEEIVSAIRSLKASAVPLSALAPVPVIDDVDAQERAPAERRL